MTSEIRVPVLGESVTEATVAKWFKAVGDSVAKDEPLVELETDKVALEVNAPAAGVLGEITAAAGSTVGVNALLGVVEEGGKATAKPAAPVNAPAPVTAPAPATVEASAPVMPAARRLAAEAGADTAEISGTGKGGRVTKGDVQDHITQAPAVAQAATVPEAHPPVAAREERVPMTRLRKRIAERLKQAQNTAAMLTTYNEVDMSPVMAIRDQYRDLFEKKHGVRLGFMSFFVKACVQALREVPEVNAEIDGDDIVYKNHYDIGVAASTPAGLVVPVVRDCDSLSLAGIEKKINELGGRARDGRITMEEMQGGTFTISNGGIFGSLMSSPILNPPQSGILGMHAIKKRPVVVDDQIVIRPMMYLALSYDHRVVDGRGAVTFLVRVKEFIEDPQRLLLDL
jgi:2-oxoglutarate dehydrogenase E2 component (dihydrolipoamide succinyltransferase)